MQSTENPSRDREPYRNGSCRSLRHVLLDRQRELERESAVNGPIAADPRGLRFGRVPLTIGVRIDRPGVAVVRLIGDVDLRTSPMIRRAVMDQLQGSPQRMIIDLERVAFLGMNGISELFTVWRIGRAHRVDVVLVASRDSLLRTLGITGVADLFTIHPTIHNALSEPQPPALGDIGPSTTG